MSNTQPQLLVVLERVGGSLSLFTISLVLLSYAFTRRLRSEPNTLLIFTSITSVLGSVACIIGDDCLQQGRLSPLCQAQGFLLDLYSSSAPLWSLALAIHLLVVFGRGSKPGSLSRVGWLYCGLCFGIPFGIALAYIHLRHSKMANGDVEGGDARASCWNSAEQDMLQLYIPVWACIFSSLVIYAGVAIHTFKEGRQLPGWEKRDSARWSSTSSAPLVAGQAKARDSILSLSDWPVSPQSGAKTGALRLSIPKPSPAHTPPTPASSWLGSFALSPRPAPTPPSRKRPSSIKATVRCFIVKDAEGKAHLWTGLLFTLSLLIIWLPGTLSVAWQLAHPTLDPPFATRAAQATIFPLQGVWIGVMFLWLNWKSLRDAPARAPSRSSFRGLLEEPLSHFRSNSVSTTGGDVEASKRVLKGLSLWQPPRGLVRSDSWDFIDIGIPSRKPSVRSVRRHSEPGFTPLLPCPPRSFP